MPTAARWISTTLLPTSAVSLGRLVGDTTNPCDDFLDTSLSTERPDGIDVTSTEINGDDFRYDSFTGRGWNFLATLTAVLGSTLSVKKEEVVNISAVSLTTRRLSNVVNYFDQACETSSVREWLERRWRVRRKAYIAVGVMTLRDAHISLYRNHALDIRQSATLPGSIVILAATQGAVPTLGGLEGVLDSEAAASRHSSKRAESSFTFPGENIFAVQYRKVDFSWFRKPSPKTITLKSRSEWKAYLGSRGEESGVENGQEDSSEDDDDISEEFVTLNAIIGGSVKPEDLDEFDDYENYALNDVDELLCVF
ncbi:hypothetical protein F4806DRAFT_473466 [Annulohypoxylon nitens]|nr:hypothetical protein F4806DRAFT_473466 [Annulohypoxylon nitens]